MRKYLALFIIVSTLTSSLYTQAFGYAYSQSNNKIIVELDDNILNLSKNPILKDGVTLIPLREIASAMNIFVDWDSKTKTIICSKDDINLTFKIDNYIMKSSEDTDVVLDLPPCLIDGTTYIPLRALSSAFNSDVYWDSELRTISIYSPAEPEDAVLSSKLKKLSLYIYAVNDGMCLDKGSYMRVANVLKPEFDIYEEEFENFAEIFNNEMDSPFGKININYSNINSYEIKKGKKFLNLSEDSVDILIDEIKNFTSKVGCKIPKLADYLAEIELYEKYIENYAVRSIDESQNLPYTFKSKYNFAEKDYNRHIKKMSKFSEEYMPDESEDLLPNFQKIEDATIDAEKILEDVKKIYIDLGIAKKALDTKRKTNIKPLIKADLELTMYLKSFIKQGADFKADKNGKTLKSKYNEFQTKYNALYIKTLDAYSKLFNLNPDDPDFSSAFDTIIKMDDFKVSVCVNNINQLLDEWKYLALKMGIKDYSHF